MDVIIRRIRPEDAILWRDARLRALATDPLAFGSTFEREVRAARARTGSWRMTEDFNPPAPAAWTRARAALDNAFE
jgi:hypothetical protein